MKPKFLSLIAVILCGARMVMAQDAPAKAGDQTGEKKEEPKVFTLTDEERAAGWRILFDGRNNYGLRGLTFNDWINRGWRIDRGSIFCVKEIKDMGLMTGGHLITLDQYLDFEFHFEWKLSVSGKSGIMYFATGSAKEPKGFIYTIMDDVHNPDGLKGGPIRRTGALYNIIPPSADKKLNGPDSWNEGSILVQGNHVEHWLNGGKVVEYDLGSPQFLQQVKASGVKQWQGFGTKFKTALLIMDDGEEVEFRNLRIRPIWNAAAPGAPGVPAAPAAATGAR
ncbi:protein of unknown function DUF1080 [Chthoniobacter flavus Ellin428]|uniref:3-keto-alpha-glucoside-1,2-lyase/3-keto-2-hydroxy-glucal hydratase domain-containing protein n=1 Tax=Chthoniobacter flavus Ellin428 TaxID=497964 RepID=B4CV79_9BACT|nr:DUF1080 domain-containing protein [Chthoniobacter flavus]EDY22467.1 protein of unknown function DUF1080 [Chthoniobacter flavus Ellin428]TCO82125.1 uncharacterized protein DUF1080 [Chthoniobacter flavus]